VMTAAAADHPSYGCGSGSTLTFFGRAMFDEQLRHTWSFEKAHAAARSIIDQREREGGKSDGFSNPQIRVGEAVRERLLMLEAQQQLNPPATASTSAASSAAARPPRRRGHAHRRRATTASRARPVKAPPARPGAASPAARFWLRRATAA